MKIWKIMTHVVYISHILKFSEISMSWFTTSQTNQQGYVSIENVKTIRTRLENTSDNHRTEIEQVALSYMIVGNIVIGGITSSKWAARRYEHAKNDRLIYSVTGVGMALDRSVVISHKRAPRRQHNRPYFLIPASNYTN